MTNEEFKEFRLKYNLPIATLGKILHIRKEVISQWHHGTLPIPERIGSQIEQRVLDYNKKKEEASIVDLSSRSIETLREMITEVVSESGVEVSTGIEEFKLEAVDSFVRIFNTLDRLEGRISNLEKKAPESEIDRYRNQTRALSRGNYGY